MRSHEFPLHQLFHTWLFSFLGSQLISERQFIKDVLYVYYYYCTFTTVKPSFISWSAGLILQFLSLCLVFGHRNETENQKLKFNFFLHVFHVTYNTQQIKTLVCLRVVYSGVLLKHWLFANSIVRTVVNTNMVWFVYLVFVIN